MAGNTVYVQGSYVDVHDNEVVNLAIDKATVNGVDINDNLNDNLSGAKEGQRSEEQFHFVHPELDEDEAWRIHDAVKRAAAHQRVPEICAYLKELKQQLYEIGHIAAGTPLRVEVLQASEFMFWCFFCAL